MSLPIRELPDALVLGAGGTLGEAWLRGMLNGIEAGGALDFRTCEYLVGTSAGAIVAASLAAGRRPDAGGDVARRWAEEAHEHAVDTGDGWFPRRVAGAVARRAARAGLAAATPFAPLARATTAPAGRFARATALRVAPRPQHTLSGLGERVARLGARFDGRLRVTAVDRASGRRVVFGAPEAPRASVADAVLASCAVPWIFAPVTIGGREYVDGGVWSPTNLDAAPVGRGGRILCLVPSAGAKTGPLRTASAAAAGYEAMALRAQGAEVQIVAPDVPSLDAFGPSLMDARRRGAAAAAGYAQGRGLA